MKGIFCPNCGSENIRSGRRGKTPFGNSYTAKQIVLTCLKCGKQFTPGNDLDSVNARNSARQAAAAQKRALMVEKAQNAEIKRSQARQDRLSSEDMKREAEEAYRTRLSELSDEKKNELGKYIAISGKKTSIAYMLLLFSLHRFYLNGPAIGILFLVTFGGIGIWWLYDAITMRKLVDRANDEMASKWLQSN